MMWALRLGTLSGCQKQKTTIFLDTAWNRDYAKNACESSSCTGTARHGGYPLASETHTLRTVIRIGAPIFKGLSRIVEHWAVANSVPASPHRRNSCNNK